MLFRGLAIIRRNGVLLEIYTYTQCCFGVNAKLNFYVPRREMRLVQNLNSILWLIFSGFFIE